MAVLVQDLAVSTSTRSKLVGDIKAQTGQMLRGYGRERNAMSKTLHAAFASERTSRLSEVTALRDEAVTVCKGFRLSHAATGQELRRSLRQSRVEVTNAVNTIRTDTRKLHAGMVHTRRRWAADQQAELAMARKARLLAVSTLMQTFHAMNESDVPAVSAGAKRMALPVPGPVGASKGTAASSTAPATPSREREAAAPEAPQAKSETAPAVVEYTAYSPTKFKHSEFQS